MVLYSGHEVEDDFFDDYIEPEDYLPKRLITTEEAKENEEYVKGEKEKFVKKTTPENPPTIGEPFLGQMEEMTVSSASMDVAEDVSAGNLLQSKSDDQRQDSSCEPHSSNNETNNDIICNRLEIEMQPRPIYSPSVLSKVV